jgi:hypothetical protein
MVSASRWNVGIIVDSNLKGAYERNESCDLPNGGVNIDQRALHARRKIINKWADARKRWRSARISAASIVKRQAGFEKLTGADAFVTDLRADPGEQPRPLRIAAVVDVEAALPDLRAVIAQYSLIPGLI